MKEGMSVSGCFLLQTNCVKLAGLVFPHDIDQSRGNYCRLVLMYGFKKFHLINFLYCFHLMIKPASHQYFNISCAFNVASCVTYELLAGGDSVHDNKKLVQKCSLHKFV